MSSAMRNESNQLAQNVFGVYSGAQQSAYFSADESMQELLKIANMATRGERETYLKTLGENRGAGSAFFDAYRKQVKSVADSIETTNITAMKIQGRAAEQIQESRLAQSLTGIADTDVAVRGRTSRLIKPVTIADDATGETSTIGFIMSPSSTDDMDIAARLANGQTLPGIGAARAAEDAVALDSVVAASELVSGSRVNAAAATGRASGVSGSSAAARAENMGSLFVEEAINKGANFYKKNKTGILIAGAVLASAMIGSRAARKNNTKDLYEDTMMLAPPEEGQRPYGIQEALLNGQKSRRRDPLFTAGVVGNLDRQKIGHTSMGSDKNSHLFGDR